MSQYDPNETYYRQGMMPYMQQQYMQQQPMTQPYPAYALPPPFPAYMQTQDSFEYRLHNERLRALLLQKDKEIKHLKEKEYLRYGGYGDV